ncbi:MAG: hypothetical protein KC983_09460, partial [Phycisphaerales bacterium]|nr:hypothetical protein [Phycisphaerales bacterium]
MQVEAFLICHAATDSGRGHLNLIGTFDAIYAREIPAVQQQCALVLRVRFERIERRDHQIQITIVDADGKKAGPSPDVTVPVNFPDTLTSSAFNFIFNLQQMRFEGFGEYQIDLAIDGRQEMSIPFSVREMPNQPQMQAP